MPIDFQQIRNANSLTDVAARYAQRLVVKGTATTGLCPFHEEKTPSFNIYMGSDSVERYICFGCGEQGDVIDFIKAINNVDTSEACRILSGNLLPAVGDRNIPKPKKSTASDWQPIIPVPDDAPEYNPAETWNPGNQRIWNMKPSRVDPYLDAEGKLLCFVVRVENELRKMTPTITYCEGPGGDKRWCCKRMKQPYPLQGLNDLAARPKDYVLLVSGEKCRAKAAEKWPKFVAVSWLGGDLCATKTDLAPLKDRHIIAWPDADDTGNKAMAAIGRKLGYR